jgi:hypothetical protein
MKGCLLSLHKFSEWRSEGASCEIKRTCRRCGKKQIRKLAIEHNWIYANPSNPCDITRHCKNCGYKPQSSLQHKFDPPKYASANSCETTITCIKCGHIQANYALHIYGPSQYISSNSCELSSTCTRCGYIRTEIKHRGQWEYVDTKEYFNVLNDTWEAASIYRCTACGDTTTEH